MNDDPDWLYTQVESLKQLGYEVIQAKDGFKGLELARAHLPDIVVSDIFMDVINGCELCACMREIDITRNIPVVLFSEALLSEEWRNRAKAAGASAILPTSPDLSDLLAAIRQLAK